MKQGFTDFGAPTKMARKLKWVSLASLLGRSKKRKIRWVFHDSMSTLRFFWGFPSLTGLVAKQKQTNRPNLRSYDSLIIRLETKAPRHWSRYLVGDKIDFGRSNGGKNPP